MFKKVKQYCISLLKKSIVYSTVYLSKKKNVVYSTVYLSQKRIFYTCNTVYLSQKRILYTVLYISPRKEYCTVYSTVYLSQKEYCRYLQAASDCGLLLSGIVHMIVYCNIYSTVGWDNLQ